MFFKAVVRKIYSAIGLRYLLGYLKYRSQLAEYQTKNDGRFLISQNEKLMCIGDAENTTSFDKHYIYHTAWAARKVSALAPLEHVDISSLTYFSTLLSAFVPTRFYDYRPAKIELSGLSCGHADITALPFPSGSVSSLSCMHVVEHIGLGRYGDPLDPAGDVLAINELKRVVALGGSIFFVVPVGGAAKIMFNAHRIYTYELVLEMFSGLKLKEFSLIPDVSSEGIIFNATKEQSDLQNYGCGCFWFFKD